MKSFVYYFRLLIYFSLITFIQGTVTQAPSAACVGDRVTVSCILTPPAGQTFTALVPRFIIGNSDTSLSDININNSVSHPGVNLTRLTAYVNAGSVTMVSGVVTLLSYLTSDEELRIGCEVSQNTGVNLIELIQLIQADPPSAPNLQSSVSNFNTTNCSADISLSWNTPPSNRTVDRYFLYLDGSLLATTNSNSYIHSTILNINTDYQYSVTAMSCAGNSTNNSSTINYVAIPPSAPSLQSSVSNFNTATCSADIILSWNTPHSNRTVDRYFLYLDGSPLATTNSNSYIHSTILNINTNYQYSVTAMNCAGNSTNSSTNVNHVASYSLMRNSQPVCLAYNNVTGRLTINWGLNTPTQPSRVSGLDITYSLQLLYSHSRQNVTYTYTNSTSFTLPSSQLSYNTVLTAHNFTQLDGVETNITANLTIVQQCGQSFSGTAMECFYDSINPPTLPPPSPNTTSPTNTMNATNSTKATDRSSSLPITVIIGCAVGGVVFLVIILIVLFVLIIICWRKGKENPKQTGTDGTDVKEYQELGEDTYSQVNKKPKPMKKDECELNYLEIDHSSGTGKIVKPPIIPKTNYADINSFPQETQYASLQN